MSDDFAVVRFMGTSYGIALVECRSAVWLIASARGVM